MHPTRVSYPQAMTDFDRLKDAVASRYTLVRELGSGGMATVYLAEDLRHNRNVAVKVLRSDLAASLGSERFFREIQVAARLQHPHILPLLDSGEAAGFYYYVMPYVQGESLRERVDKHGELPIAESVRILREVVDALAEAHANGVVHRDIKPDNVMLSGRHALVMDFGVAKAVSEATGKQKLTTAGIALGTPAYMAPEQAVADPQLDHRVDIYAVGVMGYEMLTGYPPFSGRSPQEILAAQVTQAPEPVGQRRDAVPPVLEAVIMKCLEKRPADRWQTAAALLDQLETLSTTSAGLTPTQTRPIPAVAAGSMQFPRWAAWALGGALVAGGALALSMRQRGPDALRMGQRSAVAVAPELETWPTLSPDGRMVAYTLFGGGTSRLSVQQVGGGSRVTVVEGAFVLQPAFSPDGDRLLYGSTDGLSVIPVLGGQARLLVPGALGALLPGNWSPDGKEIVYPRQDTLFVQSVEGTERRMLVSGVHLHSPSWSPDGEWIAYVQGNPAFHYNGNNASSQIMVVRVGGGTPVAITDSMSLNTSPIWIPGNRALLFISDKEGGRDIYQVQLRSSGGPAGAAVRVTTGLNPERISLSNDGTRLAWSVFTQTSNVWEVAPQGGDSIPLSRARQVTAGTQNIEQIDVSPDGEWLYYDADRSGNPDIWRQRVSGGTPEQITSDPAGDFAPAVSPDGREVAFHSTRNGSTNRDVFVMPSAGGAAVQVSNGPGDDRTGQWSPDGRTLAWADNFNPDGTLTASRNPDGTWSAPERFKALTKGFMSVAGSWRADGQITVGDSVGLHLFDPSARTVKLLARPHSAFLAVGAWSEDGRLFYYTDIDERGRVVIKSVAYPRGLLRTVAYADNPTIQGYRFGFASRRGKLYVPLVESRSDVWVAEVEQP
jgi:eukaryotic-like serine/threonine-protein kinase